MIRFIKAQYVLHDSLGVIWYEKHLINCEWSFQVQFHMQNEHAYRVSVNAIECFKAENWYADNYTHSATYIQYEPNTNE